MFRMGRSPIAKKNETNLDTPLQSKDMREDDTLALVLGEAGAGKSTFINYAIQRDGALVGHSLNPETRAISPFIANHPTHPGRRLILVDTPGFNSGLWDDFAIIQRLAKWLKQSLPPRSRRRVVMVYLVDVSQHNWKGSAGRTQLQTWCRGITDNLVIVTTKWTLTPEESGRRRERIISDTYGRKIHSFHNTWASAWKVINSIPDSPVDVSDFLFELAGTRHLAKARVKDSVSRSLSLPPLQFGVGTHHQKDSSVTKHPSRPPSIPPFFRRLIGGDTNRRDHSHPSSPPPLLGSDGHETDRRRASSSSQKLSITPAPPTGYEREIDGGHASAGHLQLFATSPLRSHLEEPKKGPGGSSAPQSFNAVAEGERGRGVSLETVVVKRLEAISARLMTAFNDKAEYKRLLSCRGSEAQALLDTFQSILRISQPEGHVRRSFIVATKRLASNADLYPALFDLPDVQRYEDQPVASGGYADIYKGMMKGKVVCLKIIRVYQRSDYSRMLKVVAREAVLWGQLSHPNLLPLYGLFRSGTQLWLVSPWAESGNVKLFLEANPSADRVLLCKDIVGGVAYLHENNVIHGDLKAENVVVDGSHRAYLTDFGLSAVEDKEILFWATQSAAVSKGGTYRWQAPELLNHVSARNEEEPSSGPPTNTQATDIYAWACVCYEIFTGHVPFYEYSNARVGFKIRQGGIIPTRQEESMEVYAMRGLTEDMWVLMTDCWAADPAKRPTVQEALSRLATVQPEDHRPSGEWKAGPAMQKKAHDDSDVPITLESLEAIIARDLR